MRRNFFQHKIPTLFGVLIITAGVILTAYLTKNGTIFVGRASAPEIPENIRISNISDNSFTVSYITSATVLGSISYGENKNLGTSIIDDRDQQSDKLRSYKIHYITIRNLKPLTKYFFSIISGQTTYLDNEEPFETTTGQTINDRPLDQQPIAGRVTLPDGSIPDETIVYLNTNDGQTISTLIKNDGSYILPLNSMRNKNLDSYISLAQDAKLKILVTGPSIQSNVILSPKQINPVPIIMLSSDYDFTIDNSPVATSSASINFPSFSASASASKNPQIVVPKNNESFSDQQPLFKGNAASGTNVKIIIHSSDTIQAQVKADSKGNWSYRPQNPLTPGEHTISITALDANGILQNISRSFIVYANGSQVDQSATPSATPIVTITATPEITIAITPTLVPSFIPSSTPTPTFIQTSLPTPTVVSKPMQSPGSSSLVTAGASVIITTAISIILFLITRGGTSSL